jgi:hypothetical protein
MGKLKTERRFKEIGQKKNKLKKALIDGGTT